MQSAESGALPFEGGRGRDGHVTAGTCAVAGAPKTPHARMALRPSIGCSRARTWPSGPDSSAVVRRRRLHWSHRLRSWRLSSIPQRPHVSASGSARGGRGGGGPPPAETLEHLASYLPELLTASASEPVERKAAVEALIHEIRISDEGLIPVYKIPSPGTPVPGQPEPANLKAVRTMGHQVGPVGFEPTLAGS